MSKKKEKKVQTKKREVVNDSWILILLLGIILLPILFYLFQRRECLITQFSLCFTSKEFVSKHVPLRFRYPADFPVDTPYREWQIKQMKESGDLEEIDFSNDFSAQAGGDRLGYVNVTKTVYNTVYDYQKEVSKPVIFNGSHGKTISPAPKTTVVKIGNGIDALALDYSGIGGLFGPPTQEYVVIKNHLFYQIQFSYDSYYRHEPKEKYMKDFNFILSTMRF